MAFLFYAVWNKHACVWFKKNDFLILYPYNNGAYVMQKKQTIQ